METQDATYKESGTHMYTIGYAIQCCDEKNNLKKNS